MKLVKNSAGGIVPKNMALESENPAVLCLCWEIVLPGIHYCFLITAFLLQLLLINLLYLGLHWWLIKFQSRGLYRAAGDLHLPHKVKFALAEKGTVKGLSWEPVTFWGLCDSTGKKLEHKVAFSKSPCHCLGK